MVKKSVVRRKEGACLGTEAGRAHEVLEGPTPPPPEAPAWRVQRLSPLPAAPFCAPRCSPGGLKLLLPQASRPLGPAKKQTSSRVEKRLAESLCRGLPGL